MKLKNNGSKSTIESESLDTSQQLRDAEALAVITLSYRSCTEHEIGKCPSDNEKLFLLAHLYLKKYKEGY